MCCFLLAFLIGRGSAFIPLFNRYKAALPSLYATHNINFKRIWFFFVETSLNIICFMGPKIFYVKIGHHTELSNQSDGIIKKNQ